VLNMEISRSCHSDLTEEPEVMVDVGCASKMAPRSRTSHLPVKIAEVSASGGPRMSG
jgi:hypothetical protein